jgi:flagellar biogenesis protein FliO
MTARIGGLAGWLIGRWRGAKRAEPRLQLVERIALGPRQSLALIDAEGRRILVATSAEGGPAFYPLDRSARSEMTLARFSRSGPRRAGGRQRQGLSW